MTDEQRELVERLLRTRPRNAFYKDDSREFINPDGPEAVVTIQTLAAENARLREERDFLLTRAGHAGLFRFGGGRWTGASSNALVTVAFGGEDDRLPRDNPDLAACYRTMLRLPRHLLSDKVWDQLESGERYVASRYDIHKARAAAEWPENARTALKKTDGEG